MTPDLRAVAVGWDDGVISARFIFDDVVTEDDREDRVMGVDMYVQDDFEDFTPTRFTVDVDAERPLMLKPGERAWAYMRLEP